MLIVDKVTWILSVMQTADERASSLKGRMESLQSELRTAQSGLKAGSHRTRELETLLGEQHSAHDQVRASDSQQLMVPYM